MIYGILAWLGGLLISMISSLGYLGVFILMTLESACIPIPSEVIMPFSGYLVFAEKFSFWLVVLWGSLGNLAGAIAAYFVGRYGGRPLVEKYGKYILISHHDLDRADRWFQKYGNFSVFFSRMLPIVRTFISFPAGVSEMPFWKFCLYTLLGSIPWAILLTYIGIVWGQNWQNIEVYFRRFDDVIIALVVILVGFYIYKKLKKRTS